MLVPMSRNQSTSQGDTRTDDDDQAADYGTVDRPAAAAPA